MIYGTHQIARGIPQIEDTQISTLDTDTDGIPDSQMDYTEHTGGTRRIHVPDRHIRSRVRLGATDTGQQIGTGDCTRDSVHMIAHSISCARDPIGIQILRTVDGT